MTCVDAAACHLLSASAHKTSSMLLACPPAAQDAQPAQRSSAPMPRVFAFPEPMELHFLNGQCLRTAPLSIGIRASFGMLGVAAAAMYFFFNGLPNRVRCLALTLYHGCSVFVHLLSAFLLNRRREAHFQHERIKCLTLLVAFVIMMVGFVLMFVKEQTDLRGAPSVPVPVTAVYFTMLVLDGVRLVSLLQVQAIMALCITFMEADLYIETKGAWPVWRDAAACIGLAGVALAATTALELRARTAFAKRHKLPIEAYGAYWRGIMGERLKAA